MSASRAVWQGAVQTQPRNDQTYQHVHLPLVVGEACSWAQATAAAHGIADWIATAHGIVAAHKIAAGDGVAAANAIAEPCRRSLWPSILDALRLELACELVVNSWRCFW